jgi:hypothetical protein
MRALVVFESMYGNTKAVAEAVAEGLSTVLGVDVTEVGRAPAAIGADVGLLVVGGPTHAFSMSRASTRRDAADKAGRPVVSAGPGIREWLEALPAPATPVAAAAFDTRVRRPRVSGSAAKAADRRLRGRGLSPAAGPETFWVLGSQGPLADGEVQRARDWGVTLARRVTPHVPA